MYFLTTSCGSYTGKLLYSDSFHLKGPSIHFFAPTPNEDINFYLPTEGHSSTFCLNEIAIIPIIGTLIAIHKIVLSVFHMIGHLFAYIITDDKGHLYHCVKGGVELLRGIIQLVPIYGALFLTLYSKINPPIHVESSAIASVFLVKIYNPNKPDPIDAILFHQGYPTHPIFLAQTVTE